MSQEQKNLQKLTLRKFSWFLMIRALSTSMFSKFWCNSWHPSVFVASCWCRGVTRSSWQRSRTALPESFMFSGTATTGATDCTLAPSLLNRISTPNSASSVLLKIVHNDLTGDVWLRSPYFALPQTKTKSEKSSEWFKIFEDFYGPHEEDDFILLMPMDLTKKTMGWFDSKETASIHSVIQYILWS